MQLKVKTLAMCLSLALGTTVLTACSSVNTTDASNSVAAISLETQGSFAIGGSYITHEGTFRRTISLILLAKKPTAIMLMSSTRSQPNPTSCL